MKLLSAPFAAVILAILLIGLAFARAETPPKTQSALMCLLGQAPVGCDTALRGNLKSCAPNMDQTRCLPVTFTRAALIHTMRCNSPDGSLGGECPLGELETVTYLGTQKSGFDVYDVKYRNNEETFVLSAGPEGEIHFQRFTRPPRWVMPPSLVAITGPSGQILFSRQG